MKGTLLLRVSDNVLEPEEWTVARLTVVGGVIEYVHREHRGVYGFESFPGTGSTLDDVSVWTKYDGTGSHPENYYEVQIDGLWRAFVEPETLCVELARARQSVGRQAGA